MTKSFPKFNSHYNREQVEGLAFPQDDENSISMTCQSFKEDSDINLMIAKYGIDRVVEGDPFNPGSVKPRFDDFTNIPDYQTMNNQINAVNAAFEQLDAQTRAEFNNDPAELLAFIQDTNNRREAQEMGLLLDEAAQKVAAESVNVGDSKAPENTTT